MARIKPFDQYVMVSSMIGDRRVEFELLYNGERATCIKCGAEIGWGLSSKRKWIPFNLDGTGETHFGNCKGNTEPDL